jgi:hypothetical protein
MNVGKYVKPLIALILATTLLSSVMVSIGFAFISGQSPNTNKADYVTFEGTAGSDYYDSMQYSYLVNQWAMENINGYPYFVYGVDDGKAPQYGDGYYLSPGGYYSSGYIWPFFAAYKSLRVGFNDYGEFATPANSGIAYGYNSTEWAQTESWASTAVNPALWIQGWVFYMNYSRFYVQRQIEAYALSGNGSGIESGRAVYSWDGFSNPSSTSTATGLITAGSLIVSGVQVLYDSARLAVGRTTIVIKDGYYNENVAAVTLTVILNKATKYAIVYKDVKILLDPKVLISISDFAFSERYEIDVARNINPQNWAYVHYYANNGTSVYKHPLIGSRGFDTVQAFNPKLNYTFFASYWPNATQYSVADPLVPYLNQPTGVTRLLPFNFTNVPDIPAASGGEPNTPVVTVQWRYNVTMWPELLAFLAKDPNREIRFVEVAGMTDYNYYEPNPPLDANAPAYEGGTSWWQGGSTPYNQLGTEVQYLNSKVFNPEDLTEANYTPNMWNAVGQSSAATDSAAAVQLAWMLDDQPMSLFDKNDTSHQGTIPYGLSEFAGAYYEQIKLSNTTGTDTTTYQRTGLKGFAFGNYAYDPEDMLPNSPPQPIAGGWSNWTFVNQGSDSGYWAYWYPSKDPLIERWDAWHYAYYNPLYVYWDTASYDNFGWDYPPNGIQVVGGPKANWLARYFNDFGFAIDREGTSPYALAFNNAVTGSAPTSSVQTITYDFFPLSTWNTYSTAGPIGTFGYKSGYAVISIARDINGTLGLSVYGWDARDTFWANTWAGQYLSPYNTGYWIPDGTVAIILNISYGGPNMEPTGFTVVKALGTITEFGDNLFYDTHGFDRAGVIWDDYESLYYLPIVPGYYGRVWFYEKLPTISTAMVDFDP